MKPQRFEIGQAVTPNEKSWHDINSNGPCMIRFGEIYHVKRYVRYASIIPCWVIEIEELSYTYDERGFDPVITDHELSEALEEVPDTVTI